MTRAWDSDGLPPRALVRALPLGVLLFVMILALPVPASAAGPHAAIRPFDGGAARTGLSWVHLHGPNASLPGPRESAALASGPGGQGALLFGGCGPSQCPLGDTWWYHDGAWQNLTGSLSLSPPARYGATLALDPSSGGVLLFGGCGVGGVALNDSWTFENGAWGPAASPSVPPARCNASIAAVPAGDGVAIFGGVGTNGSTLSDLWLFSGGHWRELDTGDRGLPGARSAAALAVDPSTGALVLFGGTGSSGQALSDTEEFQGGAWTTVTFEGGTPTPPARTAAVFGEDPSLGADILFGGQNGSDILADTWTFTNGAWSNLTGAVAHPPVGRAGAAGAFDPSDGYELMVGGRTSTSGVRNDTWAFVLPLTAGLELPTSAATPGAVLHFAVDVTGGLPPYRYNWSFGTGGHDVRLDAPYFAYDAPGVYAVNLTVLDARGVTAYANGSVVVTLPALSVNLQTSPGRIVPGTSVTLTAAAAGGTQPYSALWSGLPLGCVGNSSLRIVCTARSPGQSTVTVRITDAHGQIASATGVVLVQPAFAAASSTVGLSPAVEFQHWGWVLVPPLAAAVAMAAFAAYGTYRMGRDDAVRPPPPRPECYVPPEWSETPREFPSSATIPESLPGYGRP